MKLLLTRIQKTNNCTVGELRVDGEFECYIIEDKDRELKDSMQVEEIMALKVKGKTAIPTGRYKIDMNTVSPKFKNRSWAIPYSGKLPRLLNVKGFDGILIHPGNSDADTSGCLLPNASVKNGRGTGSVSAFDCLMKKLLKAKDEITIEIV